MEGEEKGEEKGKGHTGVTAHSYPL